MPTLGSYEEWSETVGAMLAHAGIPGFLENLDGLYADIDDEATEWEEFLTVWLEIFGETPHSASEVASEITKDGSPLAKALPKKIATALERSPKTFPNALGTIFKTKQGTRFGAEMLRLEKLKDEHRKIGLWHIVKGEDFDSVV